MSTMDVQTLLKAAVEVETTGHLWTEKYTFVPALCSRVFGDGRALLALTTINSRPRYYVVRIDSRWAIDEAGAPEGAENVRDHLDAIYDALEDDFGLAVYEDDEEVDDEPREWPAFDDRGGTAWWREQWPRLEGVELQPHPFAWRCTILRTCVCDRRHMCDTCRDKNRRDYVPGTG